MSDGRRCDVAVVGGGPAGATAAYLLARQGLHVRLFDKRHFPRPKLCAGLLTWKTIEILKRIFATGSDELCRSGIVVNACRDYRIYHRHLEIARGRLDFPFHFVDRESYDHHWLKMAATAGAQIETGVGAAGVDADSGEVRLDDGRCVRAEIIIGADGVWSRVRAAIHGQQRAKRKWRDHLATAIEAHCPFVDSKSPHAFAALHFGHTGWGYAWSFPGDKKQIMGMLHLNRSGNASLSRVFGDWYQALGIEPDALTPLRGYPLPYGNYLSRPARGKVLLIGDACGLADPLLGEGIFYAHRSAEIAAQAVTAVYGRWGEAAPAYSGALHRKVIRELHWIHWLRNLLFIGGCRRRYRGLKLAFRLIPKRLEAAIQGTRPFSRLLPL